MTIWQASRPTVIDSGIRGKSFWNRRFKFFDFGRGRGSHEGFKCCLVVALSFFFFVALPVSLWKFSHFCSRPPFRVFTLESCSLFPFLFFLFFSSLFIFHCPIMHLKIHPEQVNDLSRILAEEKRQQPRWLQKNFLRKTLFSLSIHVWSKRTF